MGNRKLKKLVFLPEEVFRNFSDSKAILVIGVLLVGIRDVAFHLFSDKSFLGYFSGKASGLLMRNIVVAVAAAVLIGAADVLFYCIPLSDLFKRFKRQEPGQESASLKIRFMKVYILANLLVTPLDALSVFLAYNQKLLGNEAVMGLLLLVLWLVSLGWFFSTIIRGANILYRFLPLYSLLAIPAVVLWMELLGSALEYIYRNWVLVFFV